MKKLIYVSTFLLSLVSSLAIAEELHKVSLQLRWDHQYQFAGYYAAKWQGYYKAAGFDVDIRSGIKPDGTILSAVKEVAAGNSDFGIGAADILIGIDQGAPLVLLASIFQQSAAEFYAKEGTVLNSPTDLINLKVARNVNDLIDVELQAMLSAEGIDVNKIVPHKHESGIQHLVDGRVDLVPGYRLSAPYEFKRQGVKVKTLRPINYGIDFYGDSLFTNSSLTEKDPAAVERFRQASLKGWQYALEHPKEIADRIGRELPRTAKLSNGDLQGYNEFQIQPVKELTLFPLVETGNINQYRWQQMNSYLKKSGLIKGSIDINRHIFDFDKIEEGKNNRRYFIIKIASSLLLGMLLLSVFFIALLKRQVRIKTLSVIESENKIRISEERYRLIMESVAVIPWEFNIPENRWTYVGPQVTTLLGYAPEEWTTMEWWLGIIHPGDQTWVPAYCADQTSRGEEHSMEYRLMAKDGTIVWVNDLVTIEMLDGKPRIMRGVLVDITDRKLAEEALIKSKQLLKDTEKIGKVGGWEFNVDTKKQTWTDEVYNIHEVDLTYDMTVEKGIGFYTPESRPIIEQAVQRAIDYGVPFDVELEIITAKGNLRNVHAIGNLDLEHGRVYGFFQDITERKKAEEEKQALESQFQQTQKLESLGVLSGGIAHDFNNILAIIKGNCSLATMDSENTENYINEIDKASDRAAALCRQMLAYAGKAHLSMTQVNMWMLVDEMITMLKSTLPQNAVIKPGLQTNIPFITADASQIRQIVMNLIINASEAIGKEQGEIKVSLTSTTVIAGQADKDYHGKAIPPGIYVCLEVTDTGCGMDEATKKRIFEPFYTTKFTGRGLGMSAVLGIILSHKGALQLISQPGQGTTFKVYLPVQTGNSVEKEDQSQSVPDVPWQGSGTILLVEDEDQVRLIAKALLKNIGFTVLEAVNGKEALELYQRNATNIILVMTDMGMPVMDGYELFYELKKLKPGLPIIISSGFGDTEVSSRIGSDNIAGLISKPYNPDQLRGILKRVLEDEVTAVE